MKLLHILSFGSFCVFCCFHLRRRFSVHRVSLVFPVGWCGQGQSGGLWHMASGRVCLALTWCEGSADLCLCSDSGPPASPWGLVMTLDLTWRVQDNHSVSRSLTPSFWPHEITFQGSGQPGLVDIILPPPSQCLCKQKNWVDSVKTQQRASLSVA